MGSRKRRVIRITAVYLLEGKMSRVLRVGTIYSRVEGLIRKNHLKEFQIPLWFDLYERFPPRYEPTYNRKEPDIEITEIIYKEDILRAKIHEKFKDFLEPFDLRSKQPSLSQQAINACQRYIDEGMTEEEAIQKLEASDFGLTGEKNSSGTTKIISGQTVEENSLGTTKIISEQTGVENSSNTAKE